MAMLSICTHRDSSGVRSRLGPPLPSRTLALLLTRHSSRTPTHRRRPTLCQRRPHGSCSRLDCRTNRSTRWGKELGDQAVILSLVLQLDFHKSALGCSFFPSIGGRARMPTDRDVRRWAEEIEEVARRIGPRFSRRDLREHSVRYLQGLISRIERKNGWQLAEQLGEPTPTNLQHFIARSRWSADHVRDDLQRYIQSCSRPSRNWRVRCLSAPSRQACPRSGSPPTKCMVPTTDFAVFARIVASAT